MSAGSAGAESQKGGLSRGSKKHKAAKKKAKKQNASIKEDQMVLKLIEMAENFMSSFDYGNANQALQRALKLQPENTEAMDLLADVYIEAGDATKAGQLLQHSCKLNPDIGSRKWFTLAQLHSGETSVKCYEKGIENLMREGKEQVRALAVLRARPL